MDVIGRIRIYEKGCPQCGGEIWKFSMNYMYKGCRWYCPVHGWFKIPAHNETEIKNPSLINPENWIGT